METYGLKVTAEFAGAVVWQAQIAGHSAHQVRIVGSTGSVYVADGWGTAFASLRFRRFGLDDGREQASVRLGNQARCFSFLDGGDLVAATDSKLFRLDGGTLKEQARWTARIPRYMDSMAARNGKVFGANYVAPSLGIVDLATGGVQRRRIGPMTFILDAPGDPLLVGGQAGGVFAVDPASGSVRCLLETPSACGAAVSADGSRLWLASGVVAQVTSDSVGPGRSAIEVFRYMLDGSTEPLALKLPTPVREVAAGRRSVWFGEATHVLALPTREPPTGLSIWRAPSGHRIVAFDPDTAAVMTTSDRDFDRVTARLTCHRLELR